MVFAFNSFLLSLNRFKFTGLQNHYNSRRIIHAVELRLPTNPTQELY
jgi:hypothetical protein